MENPLNTEITESMIQEVEKMKKEQMEKNTKYSKFLSEIEKDKFFLNKTITKQEKLNNFDEYKIKYEKSIESMKKENGEINQERELLEEQMQELLNEEKELEKYEQEYFQDLNNFQLILQTHQQRKFEMERKLFVSDQELKKLSRTSVLNDLFKISHDGHFGTISGFRLGRLPSVPVSWDEINAGLGQAALLVKSLGKRLNYGFKKYHIIPHGNFSRIELKSKKEEMHSNEIYELYHTGDGMFKKSGRKRFDQALVWFLECIQELGEFAKKHDKDFSFHFPISGDKVGDLSIKLQSNEANWTLALKHMLVDLKEMKCWTISQEANFLQNTTKLFNIN
ncbi:beclin 1 [Anaeramoeba ignava]|uniref:Beclin 1 n=1 Tax=Anaeramoeba ignava TaxID=1746090 RepID=A0A9Q0LSG9_ANAIG|nr:beclin 1 [Anaeramoeba ignava]